MTSFALLFLLLVVDVSRSDAFTTHVHVRVHSARTPSTPASLVCPLNDGLTSPQVVLPCPYDCGDHDNTVRACVYYPSSHQSNCTGACIIGDTCTLQCSATSIGNEWKLQVASALDHEEDAQTMVIDGSVVQGLYLINGSVLPSNLQIVTINGADDQVNRTFQVPKTVVDRLGDHVTSLSLNHVVWNDSIRSSMVLTKVTQLRLTYAGLETCPLEPSQVPNLVSLDLSHNRICDFDGTTFEYLHELNLSHNNLDRLTLPSALLIVDLSNNAFTRFPDAISTLTNLTNLTLDHNALHFISNNAFRHTPALAQLSLRNTSLTVVPESLEKLKNLSILHLDNNNLSTASNFSELPKSLTELSVNNANLLRFPTRLTRHTKLLTLALTSNNFSTTSTIDCSGLPKSLTKLNLSSNHLRHVPRGLTNLTKMIDLDLSGNAFEGKVDAARLPSTLTTLHLDDCKLKQVPKNLLKLSNLQVLSLRGNPLVGAFPTAQASTVICLFLDGTTITSLEAFSNSSSTLELLSCQNCTSLASLPSLPASTKSLVLSRIAMKTIVKGTLPSSLQSLSITDSKALSLVPSDLSELSQLSNLTLSRCNLSEFSFDTVLQELQTLSLANNSLVSFAALLPFATSLDLHNNQLRAFNVSNTTTLTRLNLANNAFDAFPHTVLGLSTLRVLHLEGNPIQGFQPDNTTLAFLKQLSYLGMTQDQFATNCHSPVQVKQFSMCVKTDENAADSSPLMGNNKAHSTSASKSSSPIIIVLDILLVIGLAIAVIWILRRDKREHRDRLESEKKAIYAARSAETTPSMANVDIKILDMYRLEKEAIIKSRRIGAGVHGEVWLAIYSTQRVAVKQLKPEEATESVVQQFIREAKLLSELNHPNIVAFVGVAWTEVPDIAMVTTFAGNGDLGNYLKTMVRPGDGHWNATKFTIALGIADALTYLHTLQRPVLHRDLQSKHILLDDKEQVKVGGFDAAIRTRRGSKASSDETLVARVGSVRWLAPELLQGSQYNVSVDIFALGVVLGELDTHELPYTSVEDEMGQPISDDIIKTRVADGTLRLALSPTCPSLVADLALRCSSFEPRDRPRASEVAKKLREIQNIVVQVQEDTTVAL